MADPEDEPKTDAAGAEPDAAANGAREDSEADPDADMDISDLDGGIDAALQGMGVQGADPEPDLDDELADAAAQPGGLAKMAAGQRSPILAVAVLLIAGYLLYGLFEDFSYWLKSEPRELGDAADIVSNEVFTENFDNQYVKVSGTPDVQHAARLTTDQGYVGYLRIQEGGGALFAAVPRESERAPDQFDGTYVGRMRKLEKVPAAEWVEQFFNAEDIVLTHKIEPAAMLDAVSSGAGANVKSDEGVQLQLRANDRVALQFAQEDAMVHLGKSSWQSAADAKAAIEGLGRPWTADERDYAHYRAFWIRANEDELQKLQDQLNASVSATPGQDADPKVGAMVLRRSSTFVSPAEEIRVDGDAVVIAYRDNTTPPGFQVEGGKLVPVELEGGEIRLDRERLRSARVERTVRVDRGGYVVLVDETPDKARLGAILFMLVALLGLANLAAIGVAVRRRRAKA